VQEVLRRFRLVYPDAQLHIVNDGGDPGLEDMVKSYEPTTYRYMNRTSNMATGMWFRRGTEAETYFERLLSAAQSDRTEYVMTLEDDVHVEKPTNFSSLRFDANGLLKIADSSMCPRMRRKVNELAGKEVTGGPSQPCSAAGGAIIRASALRRIANANWRAWAAEIIAAGVKCRGKVGSDMFLTAMVLTSAGTVGDWPGYYNPTGEGQRDDYEVSHGNKTFYG
jgi:hypothetical protein